MMEDKLLLYSTPLLADALSTLRIILFPFLQIYHPVQEPFSLGVGKIIRGIGKYLLVSNSGLTWMIVSST